MAALLSASLLACEPAQLMNEPTPEDTGAAPITPVDAAGMMDVGAPDTGPAPTPEDAGIGVADAGVDTGPAPTPDAGRPPVNDPCITSVSPGRHVFECEGLTYHVSVPPACGSPNCGLIFDVHGFTMSGPMEENNTELAALTVNSTFIVVQPSANPAPPRSNWSARSDDAPLFDFMMRMQRVFQTNPGRLHITGFSDGGWLTWRFICEHSDVLTSAAPAAASGYCSIERACDFTDTEQPARQIPLLFMQGTVDNYVEFECTQEQVAAVVDTWGLTSEGVVEEGAGYRLTRYRNTAGTNFETLVHDYASDVVAPRFVPDLVGHCYPGSEDPGTEPDQLFSFACAPPNAFHWGQRVLEFFERTGTP